MGTRKNWNIFPPMVAVKKISETKLVTEKALRIQVVLKKNQGTKTSTDELLIASGPPYPNS